MNLAERLGRRVLELLRASEGDALELQVLRDASVRIVKAEEAGAQP